MVFEQRPGLKSPSCSRTATILKAPSSTNTSNSRSRSNTTSVLTNSQRFNGDKRVRFKGVQEEQETSSKELVKRKFSKAWKWNIDNLKWLWLIWIYEEYKLDQTFIYLQCFNWSTQKRLFIRYLTFISY